VVAAAAAILVIAGWSSAAPQVRHGSVRLAHRGPGGIVLVVDIWRDASNGELAFRLRGDTDVSLLRGRTLFDVIEGQLSDATLYTDRRRAWSVIRARFGVTERRATAALAAGEMVPRPALMTVPKRDPQEYSYSRDFGTDLAALRRAARFAVPSPGLRLDGRPLWAVLLSRTLTSGNDSGEVGVIIYSSSPRGDDQVLLNAASAESGNGVDYAGFFARSRRRVGGPGVDARVTDDGEAILRYHGSYVLVRLDGRATESRWRRVLRQIARS
jgi:hypothetical protein